MKIVEVQSTKDFASTFLNDVFFRMAVNRVLDNAPEYEPVQCKDCRRRYTDDCSLYYGQMDDKRYFVERGDYFSCCWAERKIE